jgi:hypothetical protein
VISIFKQKSQTNALLLLVYALTLKFSGFLHPVVPVFQKGDNYLYHFILDELNSFFGTNYFFFQLISFLLLFAQATLFNRICNYQKLLPKQNFLPGMCYILITSLLPDWNHFSAPLLVNSIMIWVIYRMVALYNNQKATLSIFNIGILIGIVSLLYLPAVAFLLLMFFALLVMRPFHLREWIMGLLGFTFPYYFLFVILFITKKFDWKNIFPKIAFTLPSIPHYIWVTCGITLAVVPFIIGGFFVQSNLNKMLIQVRKSWALFLMFLITAVIIILINRATSYENWIIVIIPFAAFHAAAYYYSTSKAFTLSLHWITFIFAVYVNYFL